MKKLFLLFICILVMGFASGLVDQLNTVQKGNCIEIVQHDNPDVTSGGVTFVLLPNDQIDLLQAGMQNLGNGSFNYSYCNTNLTGWYTANGFVGGLAWVYRFEVTPNGETPTIPKAILYLGLLVVLLVIFGVIMWAHMGDKTEVWRVWWFSIMWIWMIAVTFIGLNIARDFLTSQGFIEKFFYIIWLSLMILFPFYILGAVLFTFYWIYKQKDVQNLIERGFSLEDAQRITKERGGKFK